MNNAFCLCIGLLTAAAAVSPSLFADCDSDLEAATECKQLEGVTILGSAAEAHEVAGAATTLTREDLEIFESSDVYRALRQVPGVALQSEDGWGLRPNISIRGTATDRSSRITLMEDGVLIAPAPYSSPAAYYFPTFGRISAVEVLKGPSAITQGPYTVGGAINLVSTPVPDGNSGLVQGGYGSDSTWRVHGWYGGGNDRARFLVETHQWESDGFQHIDRSNGGTGLDKSDYLAKLAFYSDPTSEFHQKLELKLQSSREESQQSYLGLTDVDFHQRKTRRYGLSAVDEMNDEHEQIALSWRFENTKGMGFTLTGYSNEFERSWYKTESIDLNGSATPETFQGTSWSNVIGAVNRGTALGGVDSSALQAILHGADTVAGSIQVRDNAREYYARGVQLVADKTLNLSTSTHKLQAGLRYHEDEEDRLQRSDNYQQLDGILLLNARGLEGNAGNQVMDAQAWAAYIADRIEIGRWTLTPGLRYENIELERFRYRTNTADPSSRAPANFLDSRKNSLDIWLPGAGAIFELSETISMVGGVHKGFATPGNEPGVDPEESVNYELGLRYLSGAVAFDAMFFFNDYENLVGVCTNSSGGDCEPGDAFNGDGVHIPGLELSAQTSPRLGERWQVPMQLTYTWMKPEFQTAFQSEFFGLVREGDPVPYVPENQVWASIGLTDGTWSFYVSGNYVDSVCTQASCGAFEATEAATVFDASAHFLINAHWELYGLVENVSDNLYLSAREPYGARSNKPRTFVAGAKLRF